MAHSMGRLADNIGYVCGLHGSSSNRAQRISCWFTVWPIEVFARTTASGYSRRQRNLRKSGWLRGLVILRYCESHAIENNLSKDSSGLSTQNRDELRPPNEIRVRRLHRLGHTFGWRWHRPTSNLIDLAEFVVRVRVVHISTKLRRRPTRLRTAVCPTTWGKCSLADHPNLGCE